MLAAYEQVVPGAADRLLDRMEKQSDHRMTMEASVVRGGSRRSWGGLVAGVVVALSFLFVSAWLISEGHGVEGTILGTVDLVSLVAVFVIGDVRKRAEIGGRDSG